MRPCCCPGIWIPIAYGGIFSVGIAYTLQVVAQKSAHPAHAAIILSMEGVFAALGGSLILSEIMNTREIWGSILMLIAIFLSQWRVIAKLFIKKKLQDL